jgi:hypothetical protein
VPSPIIPTPLDHLGSHPFSFYPAILNIQHNEWIYRRTTDSEIQVMNTKTHDELWVPRRFVGEVSLVGEPVMIVGLIKELEYREGAVYPHIRRVIEMPRAVNGSVSSAPAFERLPSHRPQQPRAAEVVGIRIESPRESRAGRIMFGTVAAGLLACLAASIVFRVATPGARSALARSPQIDLPFVATDDYSSIVDKFGPPAADQWQRAGSFRYRRLVYPLRGVTVILFNDRYAGAIDQNGRVLYSVEPFALRNLR